MKLYSIIQLIDAGQQSVLTMVDVIVGNNEREVFDAFISNCEVDNGLYCAVERIPHEGIGRRLDITKGLCFHVKDGEIVDQGPCGE